MIEEFKIATKTNSRGETQEFLVNCDGSIVKNPSTGKVLTPDPKGKYYKYRIKSIRALLHFLVYNAFVDPSYDGSDTNLKIDHDDGDEYNNHYSNLNVISHSNNVKKCKRNPPISENELREIAIDRYVNNLSIMKISRKYNRSDSTIQNLFSGRRNKKFQEIKLEFIK
jgi:hypothetical protein